MKDKIIITRVFSAPRERLWECWTNPTLIKEWWGPKDFTAPSIKTDFRVGGKYVYCMHGPKGSEFDRDMYSAGVYQEIIPGEKIVATDYFSDEEGNKVSPVSEGMGPDMPDEMKVELTFEALNSKQSRLEIIYSPADEAELQTMKKSGMEDGWNQSLDKLAACL